MERRARCTAWGGRLCRPLAFSSRTRSRAVRARARGCGGGAADPGPSSYLRANALGIRGRRRVCARRRRARALRHHGGAALEAGKRGRRAQGNGRGRAAWQAMAQAMGVLANVMPRMPGGGTGRSTRVGGRRKENGGRGMGDGKMGNAETCTRDGRCGGGRLTGARVHTNLESHSNAVKARTR